MSAPSQTYTIASFTIGINVNGTGYVALNFQGADPKKPFLLQNLNAATVAAIAAILQEQPVYYRTDGFIFTGPEPVGA